MGSTRLERTEQVVDELKATLGRATSLLDSLDGGNGSRSVSEARAANERAGSLQERLETTESDLVEISSRLVETENQRSRLMNLYVATYQLHATLEIEDVTSTIAEISRDLLGAERFGLLIRDEEGEGKNCSLAMFQGLESAERSLFDGNTYRGGDPAIDGALADGLVRMEPEAGSCALAVVPLTVQGAVVGALVVFKLVDHKPSLTMEDKDLLDLLAAHAASALLAARVYSATDRRLRTLENLVKLVQ